MLLTKVVVYITSGVKLVRWTEITERFLGFIQELFPSLLILPKHEHEKSKRISQRTDDLKKQKNIKTCTTSTKI